MRRLLTFPRRCFGDKGDVEDITEGKSMFLDFNLLPPNTLSRRGARGRFGPLLGSSPQNKLTFLNPADIISTVEFDHTGNYLATGDKGGRVVLFERNETVR